jgi:hypothetical protein
MPDSMTQILSSGPPGTKVNIAVLGDGFADGADQTTYNNKVNDLLFNGLFKNDYYFEDIKPSMSIASISFQWTPVSAPRRTTTAPCSTP